MDATACGSAVNNALDKPGGVSSAVKKMPYVFLPHPVEIFRYGDKSCHKT
jgi:hypothetical protein